MFWSFCSAKGGIGTSLIAASVAQQLAVDTTTLLVDLGDDLPDLLGLEVSDRPGIRDWLIADDEVDHRSLLDLAEPVVDGLHLLRSGGPHELSSVSAARLLDAASATAGAFEVVVADLGVVHGGPFDPSVVLAAGGDRTSLVVRACYLALRRSSRISIDIDDVIEVVEGGRALQTVDIEAVFGQPVAARVPVDPAIARAADAGLLATRTPRSLRRALARLVDDARSLAA